MSARRGRRAARVDTRIGAAVTDAVDHKTQSRRQKAVKAAEVAAGTKGIGFAVPGK